MTSAASASTRHGFRAETPPATPTVSSTEGRRVRPSGLTLSRALRSDRRQVGVVLVRRRGLGEERRERRAERGQALVVTEEIAAGDRSVLDVERSVDVVVGPA